MRRGPVPGGKVTGGRLPSFEVEGRQVTAGTVRPGEFTYSVVETPVSGSAAWAGRERRGDARLRTRLRDGILNERRNRVIVECCIKDRSRSGARLQLDGERALPKSFLLTDAASRRSFRAELIWQKGRDAGVRLVPLD